MTFYLAEADLDTPRTIIRTFCHRYSLIKETLGTKVLEKWQPTLEKKKLIFYLGPLLE